MTMCSPLTESNRIRTYATHCNTTHCNTLQLNALQHTATQCNTCQSNPIRTYTYILYIHTCDTYHPYTHTETHTTVTRSQLTNSNPLRTYYTNILYIHTSGTYLVYTYTETHTTVTWSQLTNWNPGLVLSKRRVTRLSRRSLISQCPSSRVGAAGKVCIYTLSDVCVLM